MAKTKLNFKRMVLNEYFPNELPKIFTTKNLAENYQEALGKANAISSEASEPFTFTIYKNEKSRRLLSIPNPYHYLKLIDVIINNENELFKIFNKSKFSISKPSDPQKVDNNAYSRITDSVQSTRTINESLFKGHNFCLKLDISSFFESIYTHTISWAIHGKHQAKDKIDDKTLLGNKLDYAVRNLNKKQTNGILVGNACSRLLSEIILCKIDDDIRRDFPDIDVCRFVDDYSIYFTNDISVKSVNGNLINGNSILEYIRLKLLDYNLRLNESKIVLLQSPFPSEKKEIEQLRSIVTDNAYVYFNNLLHIFKGTNDISILKYGLKVLNFKITNKNFEQIKPMLINLWCNYPSLTEEILNIILRFNNLYAISELKEYVVDNIINRCLLYRQDNELIWLLYVCQQMNIHLDSNQIKKIFEMENDLATIIILFMEKNNNTKEYKGLLKIIEDNLKNIKNVFYSNRWLLAYEIVKNKFIRNFKPEVDDFFNKLLKLDIEFYNEQYKQELLEKQLEYGEFITRSEFNENIKKIYQLINKSEDKQTINNAIKDLNKKIDLAIENKYF